jgi:hypothetical protein
VSAITTFQIPVLNLDGQPDSSGGSISPNGVSFKSEPVPVTYEFDGEKLLGWATFFRKGDQLWAEVKATNADQLKGLYPAIGGVTLSMSGTVVTRCELREVGLSHKPNQDRRIPQIP